jgi:hypothetical protein
MKRNNSASQHQIASKSQSHPQNAGNRKTAKAEEWNGN